MTTTTIRLSDDLKARVSVAASRSGTTTHGFILEAIAEKTQQAERQADLDRVAEQRYANILSTGKTIPWEEMRQYLEARSAGAPAQPPKARKLAG
jgi:predicted transcriptional regulator